MSEYRLILQPEAEADIESAYSWYESQRDGLGLRFVAAVESGFEQVLQMPTSYAVTYRGCRQLAVNRFPYVIHFLVDEERVSIVAVLHGHRDPSVWQERIDEIT